MPLLLCDDLRAGKRASSQLLRSLTVTFALLATVLSATAQPSGSTARGTRPYAPVAVRQEMQILYTGSLNFDCFPDTIFGTRGPDGLYLPRVIIWGRPTTAAPAGGRRDANAACLGPIADSVKVPFTLIQYPSWGNLRGCVSIQSFNPDTLADMLFMLRGAVGEGRNQHDSLLSLLVFGQHGLDTHRVLNLANIGPFQSYPFIAMQVRKGVQLLNRRSRSLSRAASYEIAPVGLIVDEPDTTPHHAAARAASVRVYPNPASAEANVEALNVDPGSYSVEVSAANGMIVLRQQADMHSGGNLLRTLDVTELASGYYVVRIVKTGEGNAGMPPETYPIIITR